MLRTHDEHRKSNRTVRSTYSNGSERLVVWGLAAAIVSNGNIGVPWVIEGSFLAEVFSFLRKRNVAAD